MAIRKKPLLGPLEASRSEMDLYARKLGGLQSTGTNQGAATRNRMTPPVTNVPQPLAGSPADQGSNPSTGSVPPSGPVLVASVLDVGQCAVGDRVSFAVLGVQQGQVQLGDPIVLPGTPAQGAVQGAVQGAQ